MEYDVIIVGAGHAGLEAAFALDKQNLKVALITLNADSIGLMPCNPSIGGPAKGVVTREIDCLGGIQAIAADACQLQMKLLNTSKGPGVWALRAQIDKVAYHQWFVEKISQTNIDLIIGEVVDIEIKDNKFHSVILFDGTKYRSQYAIFTTGTYLKSLTFQGSNVKSEGPDGLANANNLSVCLENLGFKLIRLKTGTPPRIIKNSIDFSGLQVEPGTSQKLCFNHFAPQYMPYDEQVVCHLIHTTNETHDIIRKHLSKSAMYSGNITGVGPRYCPSIEDKVIRFSDKPRHQIFLEPESLSLSSIYLGGFSTSMPVEVQEQMIHSLPGLKNCKIQKYAYAIEYDALDPRQLKQTLETKKYCNLYFAGQINGTSGYEEAAAQGLIAAINVANNYYGRLPLVLGRHQAYIGVMIDDITIKGVTDPYRLLTSRAEHRLNLRNDNADERLIKIGYENGMINEQQYSNFLQEQAIIENIIVCLQNVTIGQCKALEHGSTKTNQTLYDFLKRPDIDLKQLLAYLPTEFRAISDELILKINIKIKFDGYIKKQQQELLHLKTLSNYKLNHIDNYQIISHLSLEAIDKLNQIKPEDLEQARKISGVNIADILTIKLFLDRH